MEHNIKIDRKEWADFAAYVRDTHKVAEQLLSALLAAGGVEVRELACPLEDRIRELVMFVDDQDLEG